MFGKTEQEIVRGGRDGVVDTSDPRVWHAIEERARTGRFRGEMNYRRRDGTIFPGEVSTSLLKDRKGRVKTAMIIRDITARKQAEEQLCHNAEQFRIMGEVLPYGYGGATSTAMSNTSASRSSIWRR